MTPKEQALYRCMEIREQIHLRHSQIDKLQKEVQALLAEHDEASKPLTAEMSVLELVR